MQEDTIFGLFLGFERILFGIWIPFLGYFWDSLILGYFPIMFWVLLGFRGVPSDQICAHFTQITQIF